MTVDRVTVHKLNKGFLGHIQAFLFFLLGHVGQGLTLKAPATVEVQLGVSAKNPCWNMSWESEIKPTNQTRSLRNVFSSSSFVLMDMCFLNDLPSCMYFHKSVIQEIFLSSDLGPVCRSLSPPGVMASKTFSICSKAASTSNAGTNRSELM